MSTHNIKNWRPAIPVKKPDNIVSSEYASLKVFKPSYEKEPEVSMEQLLANEYQRIWLIERDEWLQKTFSQKGKIIKKKVSHIQIDDSKSKEKTSTKQRSSNRKNNQSQMTPIKH